MPELPESPSGRVAHPRTPRVVAVYVALLVLMLALMAIVSTPIAIRAPQVTAVLAAIAVCGYAVGERWWGPPLTVMFDLSLGLALLAVVFAGPWVAFAVALVPDAIAVARRRMPCGVGQLANVVSYAAMVLAGAGVLVADPAQGLAGRALALLLAGVAMAAASYVFARLLFAFLRHRERPAALIRREFLALLPLELVLVVGAVGSGLLLPALGVGVLVVFAALVYVPQAAASMLLRAPSVASLSVDAAAAVYRAALADELRLPRSDRRAIEQTDALVQHRRLPGDAADNALGLMQDALLVSICSETMPRQPAFTATTRAQVVLVARRWAQLTARCTPALNHREALRELRGGSVARDAPRALAAVARIVEREHGLTEHVAGVPRLHRAPLPRRARQQLLPRVLDRLAA